VTHEAKPWTRWWWLGSEVDRENISYLMSQYASAGFGGLEITPLYGVKGHEANYLEFLSPAWMDMLDVCITEAEEHHMGMDMNLGTGWPFGGPQITPAYAASKLILQNYETGPNIPPPELIIPDDRERYPELVDLEALMAFSGDGTILDLTDRVGENGILDWNPEEGNWELIALFCGKTGQTVKRAAPGGEGYTMDHFSLPALETYLDRFEEAFQGREGVRSFFNDSYEVYNASWTPGLFDAFLQRRGYDLRHHLKAFSKGMDPALAARIKSDYRQTLAELLLENFTRPWTSWSNERGSLTRNQAHGSPGNLLDLYAEVDIPECEIFGHRNFQIPGMRINSDDTRNVEPNPMMLKLATSAAHITQKPRISNETFTWLGEHFNVALSQCKPEVEEAFLAGINHVFYHGTTYSPQDAPWPGWLFYASVHFGPTNSFWPHLPEMNRYITRCQSVLQSGTPDNEVLVYWPVYDIWDNAEGLEMQLTVHNIQEWLEYPGIERMSRQGYSYDFISDALLKQVNSSDGELKTAADATAYKVLVIPACKIVPLATLEKILDLARNGALVIFEKIPEDVPGFHEFEERREIQKRIIGELEFEDAGQGIRKCRTGQGLVLQSADIRRALQHAGIGRERIQDYGLKYTRRSVDDGKYYYLVNHGPKAVDEMIPLNTPSSSVLIMNPQDGSFGRAIMETGGLRTRVRVQLQPGHSLFLRTYDTRSFPAHQWPYEQASHEPVTLNGQWELIFLTGGPVLPPSRKLDKLLPWTELEDPELSDFSGTAAYSLTFQKPGVKAERWLLDLGQLHESARVRINGNDLGIIWSLPFQVDVGDYLKEGENTLTIEVANLMGNRIRYMDRKGISWRNFHEINFVNIDYEPFDASGWDTQTSGLAGPVRLIPVDLQ